MSIKKYFNEPFTTLKRYIKKIIEIIRRHEMRILPGNIAFFLVLSLVPVITFIGMLGSYFTDSFTTVIKFLSSSLPKEIVELLTPFITNAASKSQNMIIYLIIGLSASSNGTYSIITASNTLYKMNQKDVLFRRIKSVFLMIMLMLLFLFLLIFLAFSSVIYKALVKIKIIEEFGFIFNIFRFLKWPLAFFTIFFVIRLLYTISTDKRLPSKYFTKGALFTTFGFTFATAIYSFYTSNLAHYDVFYGGLSNIIILMIWVYALSYILVIGMVINVNEYEKNITEKE